MLYTREAQDVSAASRRCLEAAQVTGAEVIGLAGPWPSIARFVNSDPRIRTALRLQQSGALLDRVDAVVARFRKKESRRFLTIGTDASLGRHGASPRAGVSTVTETRGTSRRGCGT